MFSIFVVAIAAHSMYIHNNIKTQPIKYINPKYHINYMLDDYILARLKRYELR
ncbi:MAG: hypothetical protein Faunusvirus33_5 [Faunusvirus sp.]|jgi:hypothetical protein|uniref:Uncharacterized protein n=1 Tax=Faunusvirus sp. TaxID=2487766 RepID=A0A3G5A063_9VIRU|nr:MAG: hypothetical protein Faunusvirus33_5 [Faunusvirus sp.]